ncbi:hypothetical protein HYT23_01590 [Candidatus Pacearchaeota archaeon]|nr:hypothetical protein [Candidatus Pacearchaeota archaeon]
MDKKLKIAGIFGIFNLVLLVPTLVISFMRSFGNLQYSLFLIWVYSLMTLLAIIATIFFYRGFIILGNKLKNHFLVVTAYIFIIATIIFSVYDIISFILFDKISDIVGFSVLFFLGIVIIFFGVGLLKLNKKFGGIATTTGILEIIAGASFVTILFAFLGLILVIPISILEIIILFRASEKL